MQLKIENNKYSEMTEKQEIKQMESWLGWVPTPKSLIPPLISVIIFWHAHAITFTRSSHAACTHLSLNIFSDIIYSPVPISFWNEKRNLSPDQNQKLNCLSSSLSFSSSVTSFAIDTASGKQFLHSFVRKSVGSIKIVSDKICFLVLPVNCWFV